MIFPNINSFPTYWENGMKLGAEHFQHLEESVEDAVRDSRALGVTALGSYGLLQGAPFTLQNAQGSTSLSVKVILTACRAVLAGGYRVEILPSNVQGLQIPVTSPSVEFTPTSGVRYHVYLSVDEGKRVGAGIQQTRPIRYPYLSPAYHLEVVPHDRKSGIRKLVPNRMKIAEWENGKILEGYIPPVLITGGHQLLERWHQFLQNQLENIYRVGVQVVKEYRVKAPARAEFCLPIVNFIKSRQGYFRLSIPQQPPIQMAAYYIDLAGLTEAMIETSDKDFVRNILKDGTINNLKSMISRLTGPVAPDPEEMAITLGMMQQFGESLFITLKGLITYVPPKARTGDRDIVSG